MTDAPRPADPLTEETLRAFRLRANACAANPALAPYAALVDDLLATLDASRAPRSDLPWQTDLGPADFVAALEARSDDALRAALAGVATIRHSGFLVNGKPCNCTAHEDARAALATPAPPSPDPEALDDAIAALDYAIGKLPPSGGRMTQAAERRVTEALDLLLALRESGSEILTK